MNNTEDQTQTADTERVDDDAPVPPGRPVTLVPTPPGFWRLVGGMLITILAPFVGILAGSTIGSHDTPGRMDPLYWGFFFGGLIGAAGLIIAIFGGARLMRHTKSKRQAEES